MRYFVITILANLICVFGITNKICANAGIQNLSNSTGTVESEHPYQSSENCYYEINAQCSPVRVRFVKFDIEDEDPTDNYRKEDDRTECEWDYVQVTWNSVDAT